MFLKKLIFHGLYHTFQSIFTIALYSSYIEELEWKCDSDFPRWMSGKHLLLHEDEWIAATSLPRHGTFQASRRKDLPAVFLQSTSWATWPISCSELFLRSQSGLLVTSCQLRGSFGAFAWVKAGVVRLFTLLVKGLLLQDSRFKNKMILAMWDLLRVCLSWNLTSNSKYIPCLIEFSTALLHP